MFYIQGNEVLHLLTSGTKQELRVDLEKFTGEKAYAKYSIFSVGSRSDKYKLTIGGYRGTAGKIIISKVSTLMANSKDSQGPKDS